MPRALPALGFAAAALLACEPARVPVVMVHLETDLPTRAFDRVEVVAQSATKTSRAEPKPWVPGATFSVLDPGGDLVEVTVTLLDGEHPVLQSTRGIERFDHRTMLHAWMYLASTCERLDRPQCTNGQTCGRCGCESFLLPMSEETSPAPWEESCPEPRDDGGISPGDDRDGGVSADAGAVDADSLDASTNAGIDASCAPHSAARNRSYRSGSWRDLEFGEDYDFSMPPPFTLDLWMRFKDGARNTEVLRAHSDNQDWHLIFEGYETKTLKLIVDSDTFQLATDCAQWPNDQAWHHFAVQTSLEPEFTVRMFLDGNLCNARGVGNGWGASSMSLSIPSQDQDPQLLIDAVHMRREAPYQTWFMPDRVPLHTPVTVGLWPMDEANTSRIAHDSACRHHASVEPDSFDDDFAH